MKFLLTAICAMSILFCLFSGCSSGGSPTTVAPPDDNIPIVNPSGDDRGIIASGTFEIDPVTMEVCDISDREGAFHYNITGFLGGHFRYFVAGWNPPFITIRLQVENPTSFQVWDVRIIYTNLYGKEVLNPDGFTNYLDPPGDDVYFNPFHYFAKEYPNQAFPVGPGGIDDEILQLYWPSGTNLAVTYVIECSLGGNAPEPYKIRDIETEGVITPIGGGLKVFCTVDDWQDNVSAVTILANDIYPENQKMYRYLDSNTFVGSLINLDGIDSGTYTVWIKAESANPNNIALWMPFEVVVEDNGNMAPKLTHIPYSVPEKVTQGILTHLNSDAFDPEDLEIAYLWRQISPSSPEGEFWGTGNMSAITGWHPPLVYGDTEFLFEIAISEVEGDNVSYGIVAVTNEYPLPPLMLEGPAAIPSPVNEGEWLTLSVLTQDPNNPSEEFPSFGYYWDTLSPSEPRGQWHTSWSNHERECGWLAPEVDEDTEFVFKVVVTKHWTEPPLEIEAEVSCTVTNVE